MPPLPNQFMRRGLQKAMAATRPERAAIIKERPSPPTTPVMRKPPTTPSARSGSRRVGFMGTRLILCRSAAAVRTLPDRTMSVKVAADRTASPASRAMSAATSQPTAAMSVATTRRSAVTDPPIQPRDLHETRRTQRLALPRLPRRRRNHHWRKQDQRWLRPI